MLRFGICTQAEYIKARGRQSLAGSGVSFSLLEVGEDATEEEIQRFEAISCTLGTSNGTNRTTFRHRFRDVDVVTMRIVERFYRTDAELYIQDRAASHGLTSCELAEQFFQVFPRAEFEASDRVLYLLRLSLVNGETYIVEPNGQPLQYIKPPFAVVLCPREPYRYPLNHLIAARAKWRFRHLSLADGWMDSSGGDGYRVDKICCIHPQARSLMKRNSRFQVRMRSVFEHTPGVDVLRTMNILNKAYFSAEQLVNAASAAFHSLKPGGIWIVGRTLEENFSNHVTFLRRHQEKWEVLDRIGKGSEMEEFAARAPAILQGSLR
jgi:hypothetical protein